MRGKGERVSFFKKDLKQGFKVDTIGAAITSITQHVMPLHFDLSEM